jgi:excisionase family DNA binding protein
MKPRSTQFVARENTASSRLHASRFESPDESSNGFQNSAARTTVTEAGKEESHLLTVHDVATMLQVPVSQDRLVTVQDAARMLCVSVSTLYGWVYQRRIPFVKIGRALRFCVADLTKFIEANRVECRRPNGN